jgi:SAM-dependent methyltransferase
MGQSPSSRIVEPVDDSPKDRLVAAWDAEYLAGRYADEPPVAFVADILASARARGLSEGIYIGCGNGRNLLPMLDAGLDLLGLDVSPEAITQIKTRRPDRSEKLVVGTLTALPLEARHGLVIGIQVFQHGTRQEAHEHIRVATSRVAPGGLLCIRVNGSETDVQRPHETLDRAEDGSFTVRYLTGPKTGLSVHFFSAVELVGLMTPEFDPVMPMRRDCTFRRAPSRGQWSQWEGIWEKHAD